MGPLGPEPSLRDVLGVAVPLTLDRRAVQRVEDHRIAEFRATVATGERRKGRNATVCCAV
jgi:hypothetical protein